MPVIEGLAGRISIPISIDTSKVGGGCRRRRRRCRDHQRRHRAGRRRRKCRPWPPDRGVGVCVMHMRGTPQTMQDDPRYEDVVQEIYDYLVRRREFCLALGIDAQRICLDPGIGFGKTHEHNLAIAASNQSICPTGQSPILIGHSRKGFIGKILGDQDRRSLCRDDRRVAGRRGGGRTRDSSSRRQADGRRPEVVRGRRRTG